MLKVNTKFRDKKRMKLIWKARGCFPLRALTHRAHLRIQAVYLSKLFTYPSCLRTCIQAVYLSKLFTYSSCLRIQAVYLSKLSPAAVCCTVNPSNGPIDNKFNTLMLKGHVCEMSLKAGDAQSGKLVTKYDGGRPTHADYNPMRKQGSA